MAIVSPSGGTTIGGGGSVLYDSLASGNVASFDTGANGIAGGHKLIHIVWSLRTDEAVNTSTIDLSFNGDNASGNYDRAFISMTNATVTGGNALAGNVFQVGCPGASAAANIFGGAQFIVPNYIGATTFKTFTYQSGYHLEAAATSNAIYEFGQWRSTSAINQFTVVPDTAGRHFVTGSRVTIIGF